MKKKYNRWLARRRLINRYDYLIEVNKLMEEYTLSVILRGGSPEMLKTARDNLSKLRGEIVEQEAMLVFLKTKRVQ